MIIAGLTGGICCGKSTVSRTILSNNIPVIDADVLAREVVVPGTPGLELIINTFGSEYLLHDGTLNRSKLGSLVFANKEALDQINKLMQPLIAAAADDKFKKLQDNGCQLAVLDAALICENNLDNKYRPLIVVQCRELTQLDRLMKRNNLTATEARFRINAQMTTEQKVARADYVIDTDNSIEESVKQTEVIIHRLRAKMYRQMLDSGEITYNQVPYPWRDNAGNDACWDCDYRPCICEKQNG